MARPVRTPDRTPDRTRDRTPQGGLERSGWGLYIERRRPGAPRLPSRLAAVPRMVLAVLRRRYPGLTRGRLTAFTMFPVLYLLSPFDLVPDVIPVLGRTDDMAVVLWFLAGLVRESGRYVEWEGQNRK